MYWCMKVLGLLFNAKKLKHVERITGTIIYSNIPKSCNTQFA